MLLGVRKSPLSVDILGGWVCFTEGKDIHVVNWDQSGELPVVILEKAHLSNVMIVRFTKNGDVLSASSDAIVLWTRSRDGSFNAGKYLLRDLSESVQQIRISSSGLRLAVALGSTVLILDAVSGEPKAQLDAHKAAVTDVCFFPLNEKRIITISEDCTFKIWDLDEKCILFESCMESPNPLMSLTILPSSDRFVHSSMDGSLRLYEIRDGGEAAKLLHSWNIAKMSFHFGEKMSDIVDAEKKNGEREDKESGTDENEIIVISRRKPRKSGGVGGTDLDEMFDAAHISRSPGVPKESKGRTPFVGDEECIPFVLDSVSIGDCDYLHILTSTHIAKIDLRSFDLVYAHRHGKEEAIISSGGAISALSNVCAVIAVLDPVIQVTRLRDLDATYRKKLGKSESVTVSIFASEPLPPHFNPEFKKKEPPARHSRHHALGRKRGSVHDQPVTFHSKVHSSGYGHAAPAWMRPALKKKKKKTAPSGQSTSSFILGSAPYPNACGVTIRLHERWCDALARKGTHNGAILSLSMNGQGSKLAIGSNDTTISLFSLKSAKETAELITCIGHRHPVTSVRFGLSGKHFISSGNDGTARIWTSDGGDCALVMDHVVHNFKGRSQVPNPEYPSEVKCAQFFSMDRFIAVGAGDEVLIYKYLIEEPEKSGLRRVIDGSRYKTVHRLQTKSHSITSFACSNTIMSSLFITSNSAKTIEIFDVCSGRKEPLSMIEDAHTRPIQQILLNDAISDPSHAQDNFELFLTSSLDSSLKLWDVRTSSCVMRFVGHSSRSVPVACSFSPCMRYVACGSEDKCVYIYDRRMGALACDRIHGATDCVSAVSYHPRIPLLFAGSFDGVLRAYTD
eukprot:TRINITY_DN5135_c0_g1_i4.p1 TRINITY_DN5135_c0_g1~~TRINITY_DN5135_c0_g1_i4.p1  ORF type:complete len:849 (+),score=202.20 TRINITY_DN5135_c0_g1_i4:38-2584(+)